jgi:hypothetical protein
MCVRQLLFIHASLCAKMTNPTCGMQSSPPGLAIELPFGGCLNLILAHCCEHGTSLLLAQSQRHNHVCLLLFAAWQRHRCRRHYPLHGGSRVYQRSVNPPVSSRCLLGFYRFEIPAYHLPLCPRPFSPLLTMFISRSSVEEPHASKLTRQKVPFFSIQRSRLYVTYNFSFPRHLKK